MKFTAKALLACTCMTLSAVSLGAQTLTIATVNNSDMIRMQKLSKTFETEHPEIKLNWVVLEENVLRQRLTTDIATQGGQFDVLTIGMYEAALWGAKGWLEPMKDLPASYDLDDVFPSVRDGLSVKGSLYALPFYAESSITYYRTDLFKDAGLTMPEHPTWTQIGVDMTSYGPDLPGSLRLGKLVKTVLAQVPDLQRLRLSSIDSIEADDDLMDAIANEKRLMPHLHLSLQAGDDMILKRMKRRHLRDDSIRFCQDVRALRPDIVFGADIIAGFPTETEEMFANSMKIVEECGLTHLHVFPYSAREGTPAARMPQVRREIVKDRAKRLRAVGDKAYEKHLASLNGTVQRLLIEKEGIARTEGFTLAAVDQGNAGEIIERIVTGHDGEKLLTRQAEHKAA